MKLCGTWVCRDKEESYNELFLCSVSLSLYFCGRVYETEEYLTSDPSRLEVTDTGLKAQHCGHPDVEIPVIKCAL